MTDSKANGSELLISRITVAADYNRANTFPSLLVCLAIMKNSSSQSDKETSCTTRIRIDSSQRARAAIINVNEALTLRQNRGQLNCY